MLRTAAIVLLAVELGGAFGNATATVTSTTDQSVSIELHVEVKVDADSVVAHLALPGEPTVSLPMLAVGDGTYRIATELKKANYQVVFETLGATSHQSQPVGLSDLGVSFDGDPDAATTSTTEGSSPISEETNAWLWLTVAFGAASLSALAFWVLGGKEKGQLEDDQTSSEAVSVDSE
jgi:hypothetical protein